jgi:hypothetical protein
MMDKKGCSLLLEQPFLVVTLTSVLSLRVGEEVKPPLFQARSAGEGCCFTQQLFVIAVELSLRAERSNLRELIVEVKQLFLLSPSPQSSPSARERRLSSHL